MESLQLATVASTELGVGEGEGTVPAYPVSGEDKVPPKPKCRRTDVSPKLSCCTERWNLPHKARREWLGP